MATLAVMVSTVQLRLTSPVAFGVQSSHSSHDHQPALGHADRELLLVALVPFVKAVNRDQAARRPDRRAEPPGLLGRH